MQGRPRKPYKQWGHFRGFRLHSPIILTLLLICILIVTYFSSRESIPSVNSVGSLGVGDHLHNNDSQLLNPTVEIVNGTELIWQIPDSPRAVLFLAHGCGGRARNFFDKSIGCPHCVGLPEERLIVINALIKKFAVLAISSGRKCWSFGAERVVVRDLIRFWIDRNGLSSVPLVALGASSGGYFVSLLANDEELRFSSIVVMIAEGLFGRMDVRGDYPPTLFVHMPKDGRRNRVIFDNVEMLRRQGVEAREVKCMEFPLNPSFLANRVPGVSGMVSERLFELFRVKGFIDANGYMKVDGRQTPWVKALKESRISFPYETVSMNHVQEELNLAYAYHEMTSLQSKEMFEWFESHMR